MLMEQSGPLLRQGVLGQGIVPRAYHPLVDRVPDSELAKLDANVRGVIASCVAAMPMHEQFIDRYCRDLNKKPLTLSPAAEQELTERRHRRVRVAQALPPATRFGRRPAFRDFHIGYG